jgi:hypothetical protein
MTVANFIPQVWAASFLDNLLDAHVIANVVNRDFEGDIKAAGDTVRINSIGPITITPYVRNTTVLSHQRLTGANQTMVVDQSPSFDFEVDDLDKAQIKGSVLAAATKQASWSMAEVVDLDLGVVIQASVPTASTNTRAAATVGVGAGDEDAFEILVDLRVLLDKTNTPRNDRWCIVPPDYVGALLKDPRFSSFGTSQNLSTALTGDFMQTMVGMKLYVSNNLPTSGTATYILAGYKGAVTYAEAIPEGQPEAFRDTLAFGDIVRGLMLYGRKVTRPSNLAQCLVTFS